MKLSMRTWAALILGFLAGVFVLQNTEVVDITFLAWRVSLSRVLVLLISIGVGVVIGLLLGWELFRKRDKPGKVPPAMEP